MKKGMYSVHLSLFSLDVFIVIDVNRNMHSSYVSCLHLLYSFLTSGLANACSIKWLLIIFFFKFSSSCLFCSYAKTGRECQNCMSGFQPSKGENASWCECCSGGSCTVGSHKTKVRLNSLPIICWAWERCLSDGGTETWALSKYLPSPMKVREVREQKHSTAMDSTQGKHTAHSWEANHTSPAKPNMRPHQAWSPPRNSNLTQTLPKLHLDTLKGRVCIGSKWPIIPSFLVAWSDYQYSFFPLDRMLVHHKVTWKH